jgi:hypothetical protein
MRRLALTLPLAALVLAGAGCGATTAVQTNPATGNVTYDGGAGEHGEVGTNVQLPANWPSDVPMYAGANIVSATTIAQGISVLFQSADAAATVSDWYQAQLTASGWTKKAEHDIGIQRVRVYEKADATLTVSSSTSDEGGSATLLLWAPNPR